MSPMRSHHDCPGGLEVSEGRKGKAILSYGHVIDPGKA